MSSKRKVKVRILSAGEAPGISDEILSMSGPDKVRLSWHLTQQAYIFKGYDESRQRLQRHIAVVRKARG